MPRKITEEAAVATMIARGTRPVEPFPGTQVPWRCECLICGEQSSPRYNDVVNKGTGPCNGKCRSQKIAQKNSRDGAEAAAVMRKHGWEPLEEYPGAGKPWQSRCIHCGVVKPKKLAHVQQGRGGCTNCAGRDVTAESARAVMIAAGLEPLVEFPGALRPWLCRCQHCGHIGSPCYSKVKMRGPQCWSCRSKKISRALQLDDEQATASMLERQLEPLEPYPGNVEASWKSRCMVCDTVLDPGPTLHNIRSGQGGCPTCAERGINPARRGYLYLVVNDDIGAFKWGIANIEQRIAQHVSQGWHPKARWNFDATRDAWEIERAVKSWIRGQGIPPAVAAGEMKYRGHTETARLADIDLALVIEFITKLAGGEPTTAQAEVLEGPSSQHPPGTAADAV